MKRLRVLDLCSGLQGWSRVWKERGHVVTTLDNDPRFEADICEDIRKVRFDPGEFDVVLGSPPCELFSTAGWHQHAWRMTGDKKLNTQHYMPVKPVAVQAIQLVTAVVDVIMEVKPKLAIIENPRGLLRQLELIPGEPQTVWYCHYGEARAKPTDLWTFGAAKRFSFEPPCHNRRAMHPSACCCNDHNFAPRGSTTGTQGMDTARASLIPEPLAVSVCDQAERMAS